MEQNEEQQSKIRFSIPPQYLVALGLVALLVIAFSVPRFVLTYKANMLAKECLHTQPKNDCTMRMRAMGHLFASAGKLDVAETWYTRSAGVYDAEAMFHIGWLHYQKALLNWKESADWESVDFTLARLWFHKSAQLGFAPAMNNLGVLYLMQHNSRGIGQSWIIKAADKHNPVAMWNVVAHQRMLGVKNAKKWEFWHPHRVDEGDMHTVVLERTFYGPKVITPAMVDELRVAMKENKPFKFYNVAGRNYMAEFFR